MIIQGFQKTSFVDYPGNICATIFTGGCNMKCPYCHNSALVVANVKESIQENEVLSYLEEKKHLLDGICITGGEPTLQKDLLDFIKKVKSFGLKVKLDSNGSNPEILQKIFDQQIIDFIAMDVKQIPSRYKEVAKTNINTSKIAQSIELIKNSRIEYEFRTTVVPQFTNEKDIIAIAEYLKGAKKYCLQQFVPSSGMFDLSLKDKFSSEKLHELGKLIEPMFTEVEVRV